MVQTAPQHIVVVGLPGAALPEVANKLNGLVGHILWPQQACPPAGRDVLAAGENPALRQIHEAILAQTYHNWFTSRAPRWYDLPLPGPREYLAQFGASTAILCDPLFCFFLPAWRGLIGPVLHVPVTIEASALAMYRWRKGQASLDACRKVAHHYQSRLTENLRGCDVRKLDLGQFRRHPARLGN